MNDAIVSVLDIRRDSESDNRGVKKNSRILLGGLAVTDALERAICTAATLVQAVRQIFPVKQDCISNALGA
jgi:hypothetical protein